MALMRVQPNFSEAQPRKQPAVARQRQADAQVQPRQAAPPCLGLRGADQQPGQAPALLRWMDAQAADIQAAIPFRPQDATQGVLHHCAAARRQVVAYAVRGFTKRTGR